MVGSTPEPRQRLAILFGLPRRQVELISAVEKRLDIGRSQVAEMLIDAGLDALNLSDGEPLREVAAPDAADSPGALVAGTAGRRKRSRKP